MSHKYGDRAEFLAVYVREAHPIEGWRMESNDRVGVAVAQPTSNFQRVEVATQCHDLLEMSMPVLVDGIDDRVGRAYSGMPDRLYIIDREGKVAFKSGRGPFWFNPAEMEQALIMMLLENVPPVKKAVQRVPASGVSGSPRKPGSDDHDGTKP
jgi:Iodothyronine deiodinase